MVNMQAMQELLSSLGLLSSLQLLIKTKTDELGTNNSKVQELELCRNDRKF